MSSVIEPVAATAGMNGQPPDPLESHTGGEPPKLPSRGINLMRSVNAHWRLAFCIAAFIIFVLGPPLVWVKGKHYYRAEGVIYVSPRFAKNLEQDQELVLESNSQYREFVEQQVRTINRFDIVLAALKSLGEKRFLWQRRNEQDRIAAERLLGLLEIKPVADTYQITIGLEGTKPDGLAEVINAVISSYLNTFKNEELFGSQDRVQALEKERTGVLQEIDAKTRRRTDLAQQLAVTTFNDSNPNPYDQLLVAAKSAYAQARRQRFEAEAQLASVDGKNSVPAADALRSNAEDIASRDPGLTSLKANLNQRRAELLTKRSGLADTHPGRRAIDQEISEIDAEIDGMKTKLIASFSKMLIAQKSAEVVKQRQIEDEMSRDVERNSRQASEFSAGYQEAMARGRDIERLRKRLDAIDDRIGFLGLEGHAPGFLRVFSQARRPLLPSKSGHKKLALIVVFAGLLLGIAVPVAVDFLDPRLHVVNDLENLLGFTPAGWIPEKRPGTEMIARDCRMRLALALLREHHKHCVTTFLLTAVKPGAGTSSLALELATEMHRQGANPLVLEANAFCPDARFGASAGLNAALVGRIEPAVAILTGDRLPPRLPVGDPGSERQLASIGRMAGVIADLHQTYPVILIDAPPILLSGDTEFLVSLADVTLLIADAEGVTKAETTRAARTLEKLNPRAVGSVLNRVAVFESGGYYRETLQEYKTAARSIPSVLFSPWRWK
jgi:polysaccharide biosynthesis transport protein